MHLSLQSLFSMQNPCYAFLNWNCTKRFVPPPRASSDISCRPCASAKDTISSRSRKPNSGVLARSVASNCFGRRVSCVRHYKMLEELAFSSACDWKAPPFLRAAYRQSIPPSRFSAGCAVSPIALNKASVTGLKHANQLMTPLALGILH